MEFDESASARRRPSGYRLTHESVYPLTGDIVVQHSINHLWSSHRLHQGLNPAPVSQNFFASEKNTR